MSEMTSIGVYSDPLVHGHGPINDISQYVGGHLSGFQRHDSKNIRRKRVIEAARLMADVASGREDMFILRQAMQPTMEFAVRHIAERYPNLYGDVGGRNFMGLRETMSATDYQALYIDVIDRLYYGYFNAYPIPNRVLCKEHTLRDFRLVSRYMYDGMVTPFTAIDPGAMPSRATRDLFGPVPQDGATLGPATSTAPIQYQPKAYQAETAVNWRAFVNDDLGIFTDTASRLAMSGTRGIHKFLTTQFFDTNGPHASLYTSGYGNIINTANGASVNNPPLGAQGLMDAFKILSGMLDAGGDPIMVGGKVYVVYGPQYTAVAQNLKRSLTIQLSVEGGLANSQGFPSQYMNVENWVMGNVELVLDPYIPLVSTSHKGSWAVVVDPNGLNRPAVEFGTLSGFSTPQMYRKMPNTVRVDGGVDTLLGDFYTMDQETKILSVFGAAQIDGRSTVGSNGSSS